MCNTIVTVLQILAPQLCNLRCCEGTWRVDHVSTLQKLLSSGQMSNKWIGSDQTRTRRFWWREEKDCNLSGRDFSWYQLTLNCLFPLSFFSENPSPRNDPSRPSQLQLRELVEGKSYSFCVPSLLEQHWIESFFLWFSRNGNWHEKSPFPSFPPQK